MRVSSDGHYLALLDDKNGIFSNAIDPIFQFANIDTLKEIQQSETDHSIYMEDEHATQELDEEDEGDDEEHEEPSQLASDISTNSLKSVSQFSRSYKFVAEKQQTRVVASRAWHNWMKRDLKLVAVPQKTNSLLCGSSVKHYLSGFKPVLPKVTLNDTQLAFDGELQWWDFWNEHIIVIAKHEGAYKLFWMNHVCLKYTCNSIVEYQTSHNTREQGHVPVECYRAFHVHSLQ